MSATTTPATGGPALPPGRGPADTRYGGPIGPTAAASRDIHDPDPAFGQPTAPRPVQHSTLSRHRGPALSASNHPRVFTCALKSKRISDLTRVMAKVAASGPNQKESARQ